MTVRKFHTVAEVAAILGVHENKVLGWINSGDLVAVNTSQACGQRPRWRISDDEWAKFIERRRSIPTPKPTPRSRRTQMAGVVEFLT